jgi:hypothetical protein
MIQGSEVSILHNWQNFYVIMGTAAATLTGLMFVATTLLAGLNPHLDTANAGISAFNTPTVAQFCVVLSLAGIFSAPWQAFSLIDLLLGLLSVGMVVYQIVIMQRMLRMPHYQSTLEDWLWYMVFPFLANITFMIAAILLSKNPSLALYLVASAMMMLLLIGIRNAWDNVTFLALMRAHSHPEDQATEKKRDNPSEKQHTSSQRQRN